MSNPRFQRIPRRFHAAIIGTTLTTALTAVVSFALTIKNVGMGSEAVLVWLTGWMLATLIAVPARFVLAPLVHRLVGIFTEPPTAQN